jgi:hypothetical protein
MKKGLLMLLSIFAFLIGASMLRDMALPRNKLTQLKARVQATRLITEKSGKSISYSLDLTIDRPPSSIKIDYSTPTERQLDSTQYVIEPDKLYTFYLKRKIVYEIDDGRIPIYQKQKGFIVLTGIFCILVGITVFVATYPRGKPTNDALPK